MKSNLYNIRIGEHTEIDVSVHKDYKPPEHNIRVMCFANGSLVIGTVVGVDQNQRQATMTLPMFVDVDYCEKHDEEEAYEFTPYLRNVIPFDVTKPIPVTFNLDHCINVTEPAQHLLKNYCHVLFLQKAIADELNHVSPVLKPN